MPERGGEGHAASVGTPPIADQRRFSRAAEVIGWLAVLGALVVFSWPSDPVGPTLGLDPSWAAGLALASEAGFAWGRDITFTYGPLGPLDSMGLWSDSWVVAPILWAAAVQLAVVVAVFLAARRSFAVVPSVVVAWLAALGTSDATLALLPFVGAAVMLQRQRPPAHLPTWAAVAGGGLAIVALIKPSTAVGGVAVAAFALLLVARETGARPLVAFAGAFVIGVVAAWVAVGQPLSTLASYVADVRELVDGYPQAMIIEEPGRGWEYPAAACIVAAGAAAFWSSTAGMSWWRRVGLVLLWLGFAWFLFRATFVRHDAHSIGFFGATIGALAAARWRAGTMRVAGVALLAATAIAFSVARPGTVWEAFDPIGRASGAADAAAALFSAPTRDDARAQARAEMQAWYAVPEEALDQLRRGTVHVAPTETAAIWAYDLRWRPLPVFQDYTTYTAGLDEKNADALRAGPWPDRVLVERGADLDYRLPIWSVPRTALELLCRYRTTFESPRWLVLTRAEDRCGPERPLEAVRARWDQSVPVPRGSTRRSVVLVRPRGLAAFGVDRVRQTLFRGQYRWVTLDGERYRVMAGAANGGPIALGSTQVDPLLLDAESVAFGGGSGDTVEIEFTELVLEPQSDRGPVRDS